MTKIYFLQSHPNFFIKKLLAPTNSIFYSLINNSFTILLLYLAREAKPCSFMLVSTNTKDCSRNHYALQEWAQINGAKEEMLNLHRNKPKCYQGFGVAFLFWKPPVLYCSFHMQITTINQPR